MIESQGSGRRVVVTGVGVTAPCGVGAEAFWSGLAKPMEAAVVREAPGFDSAVCGLSRTDARRLDRFAQFAVASSAEALTDAGLLADPAATGPLAGVRPARVGVLIGSAVGGAPVWDKQMHILREKGARRVSPRTIPMVMPNSAAAAVSMRWGMQGPCETIATACATGAHAIGAAARWIASGRADLVIAGAAESCLTPIALAAFGNMRALSTSGISRPFDTNRDGFCASEGAGVLVLEEAEHAVARRARVYAEVSGVASTADAYHITAPSPDGTGAVSCMRLALDDAELTPSHVTHVNAHGTSTPLNDATEVHAIRTVFGHHRPAVTSVKGVTGHSLGASGAVEAVALMLSYARRTLPPTMHTTDVDPALDVDVVLSPRPWEPAPAITNSFAFGGHNSSVVFVPPGHRDVARADGG